MPPLFFPFFSSIVFVDFFLFRGSRSAWCHELLFFFPSSPPFFFSSSDGIFSKWLFFSFPFSPFSLVFPHGLKIGLGFFSVVVPAFPFRSFFFFPFSLFSLCVAFFLRGQWFLSCYTCRFSSPLPSLFFFFPSPLFSPFIFSSSLPERGFK